MKELIKDSTKQLYKTTLGEDNDEVIIGDELSLDTVNLKPKIKFTKWGKENSLSIIIPDDLITDKKPKLENNNKTLEIGDNKVGFYFEPQDDEINFKFGLIFYEKPTTNTWTFQLERWEEFDFFYQPPLANVNADGSSWEYMIDKEGNIVGGAKMSAEGSGSYAIYHKTKKDYAVGKTNYKNGKFGHYLRPKFIDANGISVWANLDIKDGVVTITIPQEFLENATYPTKANDIFGTDTYPTEGWSAANYYQFHTLTTTTEAGVITQFSWYGRRRNSANANVVVGLYQNGDVDYNENCPDERLDYSPALAINSDTAQWWNGAAQVGYTLVASTKYWFVFCSNTDVNVFRDTGAANTSATKSNSVYSSPPPNPFGSFSSSWITDNYKWSIYATYTPSGAGGIASRKRGAFVKKRQYYVFTRQHYTQTYTQIFTDGITATDTPFNRLATYLRNFTETSTLTEIFVRLITYLRSFTESSTITETTKKDDYKILLDSLNVTELFNRLVIALRDFTESPTITEDIKKDVLKNLTDTSTLTELFTRLTTYYRNFTETSTLTETFLRLLTYLRIFTETPSLVENITKDTLKEFIDTPTITELFSRLVTASREFTETTTITEAFNRLVNAYRLFTETATIQETFVISKILERIFTETVNLIESLNKATDKKITDTSTINEVFVRLADYTRNYTESVTITDSLLKFIELIRTESISISDSLIKESLFNRIFTDTASITEEIAQRAIGKYLQESLSIAETTSKFLSRILIETITSTETKKIDFNKVITDSIATLESIGVAITKVGHIVTQFLSPKGIVTKADIQQMKATLPQLVFDDLMKMRGKLPEISSGEIEKMKQDLQRLLEDWR